MRPPSADTAFTILNSTVHAPPDKRTGGQCIQKRDKRQHFRNIRKGRASLNRGDSVEGPLAAAYSLFHQRWRAEGVERMVPVQSTKLASDRLITNASCGLQAPHGHGR